jgi:hypothetical protein
MAKPDPKSHKKRRRATLVLASFLSVITLLLGVSVARPAGTTANWNFQNSMVSSLTAAEVGNVSDLQCFNSEVLLQLGSNQIQLTWNKPQGLDDAPVLYVISWVERGGLLGGVVSRGETEVSSTSFIYQLRSSLISLNSGVEITIYPHIANTNWRSDGALSKSASGVNVLGLGLLLTCDG